MIVALSTMLPAVVNVVRIIVDNADQTIVSKKKLEGVWDGKVDGPEALKHAIETADILFKYLRENNRIDKKEIPSEEVLRALIETIIANNKKEEKQSLTRATHEDIKKFLSHAIDYTKYTYVQPTVKKDGISSYGDAEKVLAHNTCKQAIRSLLISNDLYFDNAALDVYIGSRANELEPESEPE